MANSESEILHQALVACGKELDTNTGRGVYQFLSMNPTTIICDLMAQKLNELGYRVTKRLETRKTGEK